MAVRKKIDASVRVAHVQTGYSAPLADVEDFGYLQVTLDALTWLDTVEVELQSSDRKSHKIVVTVDRAEGAGRVRLTIDEHGVRLDA